ncbi:Hypothetical protein NTJ_15253 [Nesidiocoris tenuis]|uniref:THAP-type domain-containing protein n=1 Tax=Nesidiocoris tenuis TaxID=355587 RepID=A0ABN7BFJ4_9HEMI|nr:Hypothetical protein NTJ_15253 [Nesidiocoris tenuis]
MVSCSVLGCDASSSTPAYKGVTFHRLPDPRCFPRLYGKWRRRLVGLPDDSDDSSQLLEPTPSTRVCSTHFTSADFVQSLDKNRRPKMSLRPDALPSQRLPLPSIIPKDEYVNGVSPYPECESRGSTSSIASRVTLINTSDNHRSNVDNMIFRSPNSLENQYIPSPPNVSSSAFSDDTLSVSSEQEVLVSMLDNKRIKIEPHDLPNGFFQNNENMADSQLKQLISSTSQPDTWQDPLDPLDDSLEDELHIPPCYRKRKSQAQSSFVVGITPLNPEHGISILLVNDYKFLKCDMPQEDRQTWRCIIKSCQARVETSAVHHTILFAMAGLHFHLPTRLTPVSAQQWLPECQSLLMGSLEQKIPTTAPLPPPWTIGRKWQGVRPTFPDVVNGQAQSPAVMCPPWVRAPIGVDSTNGLVQSDLLTEVVHPSTGLSNVSFTSPAVTTYPVFSSIEELSKFCNGPVIQCVTSNMPAEQQQLELTTTVRGGFSYPPVQDDNGVLLLNNGANVDQFISDEEPIVQEDEVCYTLPNIPPSTGTKRSFDQSECSTLLMESVAKTKRQLDLVNIVDVEDIMRRDHLAINQPWDEGVVGMFQMR